MWFLLEPVNCRIFVANYCNMIAAFFGLHFKTIMYNCLTLKFIAIQVYLGEYFHLLSFFLLFHDIDAEMLQ